MDRRSLIRSAVIVIAVLASIWAIVLAFTGGFDLHLPGLSLTTHDPTKPIWVAIAAWIAFALVNGVERTMNGIGAAVGAGRGLARSDWRVDPRLLIAVLTIATFVVCARFRLVAVGGSDSYGYASEADTWLSGSLTLKQAWVKDVPWEGALDTFTPLGWRRGPADDELAPKYAPGLPLLMTAATAVAGHCAIFFIGPFAAAMLVLGTYGLGRRLQAPRVGVAAAWLVACAPIVIYMGVQPMSDVPAAAAWTGALYFAFGGSVLSAAGAGLLVSLAVLTRPNLAPLIAVFGLWYAVEFWRAAGQRRAVVMRAAVFGLTAIIGPIAQFALNATMYGSAFESGYGDVSDFFAMNRVWPNLTRYASWFSQTETPIALVGLVALVLPFRRLWAPADRAIVWVMTLFTVGVIGAYAVFLTFDAWWFLRFLLPAFPPVMIGFVMVCRAVARVRRPVLAIAMAALLAAIGIRGVFVARQFAAFDIWREGEKYASVARLVRGLTERTAVIYSMQHSGSLRYYGGRLTLTYSVLNRHGLDESVRWFTTHGVHAYALLEEWEVPVFEERFAGQGALVRLQDPPVLKYTGPATVLLFDLTPRRNDATSVEHEEDYAHAQCELPSRPPRLVLPLR